MIFYFTGTGNSLAAAKKLAQTNRDNSINAKNMLNKVIDYSHELDNY